jgi:hypothetical protein
MTSVDGRVLVVDRLPNGGGPYLSYNALMAARKADDGLFRVPDYSGLNLGLVPRRRGYLIPTL